MHNFTGNDDGRHQQHQPKGSLFCLKNWCWCTKNKDVGVGDDGDDKKMKAKTLNFLQLTASRFGTRKPTTNNFSYRQGNHPSALSGSSTTAASSSIPSHQKHPPAQRLRKILCCGGLFFLIIFASLIILASSKQQNRHQNTNLQHYLIDGHWWSPFKPTLTATTTTASSSSPSSSSSAFVDNRDDNENKNYGDHHSFLKQRRDNKEDNESEEEEKGVKKEVDGNNKEGNLELTATAAAAAVIAKDDLNNALNQNYDGGRDTAIGLSGKGSSSSDVVALPPPTKETKTPSSFLLRTRHHRSSNSNDDSIDHRSDGGVIGDDEKRKSYDAFQRGGGGGGDRRNDDDAFERERDKKKAKREKRKNKSDHDGDDDALYFNDLDSIRDLSDTTTTHHHRHNNNSSNNNTQQPNQQSNHRRTPKTKTTTRTITRAVSAEWVTRTVKQSAAIKARGEAVLNGLVEEALDDAIRQTFSFVAVNDGKSKKENNNGNNAMEVGVNKKKDNDYDKETEGTKKEGMMMMMPLDLSAILNARVGNVIRDDGGGNGSRRGDLNVSDQHRGKQQRSSSRLLLSNDDDDDADDEVPETNENTTTQIASEKTLTMAIRQTVTTNGNKNDKKNNKTTIINSPPPAAAEQNVQDICTKGIETIDDDLTFFMSDCNLLQREFGMCHAYVPPPPPPTTTTTTTTATTTLVVTSSTTTLPNDTTIISNMMMTHVDDNDKEEEEEDAQNDDDVKNNKIKNSNNHANAAAKAALAARRRNNNNDKVVFVGSRSNRTLGMRNAVKINSRVGGGGNSGGGGNRGGGGEGSFVNHVDAKHKVFTFNDMHKIATPFAQGYITVKGLEDPVIVASAMVDEYRRIEKGERLLWPLTGIDASVDGGDGDGGGSAAGVNFDRDAAAAATTSINNDSTNNKAIDSNKKKNAIGEKKEEHKSSSSKPFVFDFVFTEVDFDEPTFQAERFAFRQLWDGGNKKNKYRRKDFFSSHSNNKGEMMKKNNRRESNSSNANNTNATRNKTNTNNKVKKPDEIRRETALATRLFPYVWSHLESLSSEEEMLSNTSHMANILMMENKTTLTHRQTMGGGDNNGQKQQRNVMESLQKRFENAMAAIKTKEKDKNRKKRRNNDDSSSTLSSETATSAPTTTLFESLAEKLHARSVGFGDDANRFRNFNELRYSLRSLYRYVIRPMELHNENNRKKKNKGDDTANTNEGMGGENDDSGGRHGGGIPRVTLGKIYIIVSHKSQAPPWMKTTKAEREGGEHTSARDDTAFLLSPELSDKIIFVEHKDLFPDPDRSLPTFNSRAIESVIHRIPNLSRHYMYLNNDFMIARPVTFFDFFQPVVVFQEGEKIKLDSTEMKKSEHSHNNASSSASASASSSPASSFPTLQSSSPPPPHPPTVKWLPKIQTCDVVNTFSMANWRSYHSPKVIAAILDLTGVFKASAQQSLRGFGFATDFSHIPQIYDKLIMMRMLTEPQLRGRICHTRGSRKRRETNLPSMYAYQHYALTWRYGFGPLGVSRAHRDLFDTSGIGKTTTTATRGRTSAATLVNSRSGATTRKDSAASAAKKLTPFIDSLGRRRVYLWDFINGLAKCIQKEDDKTTVASISSESFPLSSSSSSSSRSSTSPSSPPPPSTSAAVSFDTNLYFPIVEYPSDRTSSKNKNGNENDDAFKTLLAPFPSSPHHQHKKAFLASPLTTAMRVLASNFITPVETVWNKALSLTVALPSVSIEVNNNEGEKREGGGRGRGEDGVAIRHLSGGGGGTTIGTHNSFLNSKVIRYGNNNNVVPVDRTTTPALLDIALGNIIVDDDDSNNTDVKTRGQIDGAKYTRRRENELGEEEREKKIGESNQGQLQRQHLVAKLEPMVIWGHAPSTVKSQTDDDEQRLKYYQHWLLDVAMAMKRPIQTLISSKTQFFGLGKRASLLSKHSDTVSRWKEHNNVLFMTINDDMPVGSRDPSPHRNFGALPQFLVNKVCEMDKQSWAVAAYIHLVKEEEEGEEEEGQRGKVGQSEFNLQNPNKRTSPPGRRILRGATKIEATRGGKEPHALSSFFANFKKRSGSQIDFKYRYNRNFSSPTLPSASSPTPNKIPNLKGTHVIAIHHPLSRAAPFSPDKTPPFIALDQYSAIEAVHVAVPTATSSISAASSVFNTAASAASPSSSAIIRSHQVALSRLIASRIEAACLLEGASKIVDALEIVAFPRSPLSPPPPSSRPSSVNEKDLINADNAENVFPDESENANPRDNNHDHRRLRHRNPCNDGLRYTNDQINARRRFLSNTFFRKYPHFPETRVVPPLTKENLALDAPRPMLRIKQRTQKSDERKGNVTTTSPTKRASTQNVVVDDDVNVEIVPPRHSCSPSVFPLPPWQTPQTADVHGVDLFLNIIRSAVGDCDHNAIAAATTRPHDHGDDDKDDAHENTASYFMRTAAAKETVAMDYNARLVPPGTQAPWEIPHC